MGAKSEAASIVRRTSSLQYIKREKDGQFIDYYNIINI